MSLRNAHARLGVGSVRRTARWPRAVLLALLGWSLLLAAQLGQWHRYAHAPHAPHEVGHTVGGERAAADAAQLHAGHGAGHGGWFARLFGDHSQLDCQLLDQLGYDGAPGAEALPWLPGPAPEAWVRPWRALALPDFAYSAYQARGPPLPRA